MDWQRTALLLGWRLDGSKQESHSRIFVVSLKARLPLARCDFLIMNAPVPSKFPSKMILLVEDNPDDEALTMRELTRHGFSHHVEVAHDGVEALDFLFARGPHAGRNLELMPAVTLLDLKLPRLDGLEVLRSLRENARTRSLPVVVLTSSREEQDLVQSYGYGANSYIRKPVDYAAFTEAVRQLGAYWLALNETPPTS
jgi:CheY-like chemotaxis protein